MEEMNLDQRITVINKAYDTLCELKTKVIKQLEDLSKEGKPLNFIKGLIESDGSVEFSVWNNKFIIHWGFRKGDLKNIMDTNYYLKFTISEIKNNGSERVFEKIDSFIITFYKNILYKEEKNLFLDYTSSLTRTFKLIFEAYFNKNLIKSTNAE